MMTKKYIKTELDRLNAAGYEDTPKHIVELIGKDLENRLSEHKDYIAFLKQVYGCYIGDYSASQANEGYVFLTFFPVEDIVNFDDPFENGFFLFAEAEEYMDGQVIAVAYYLSIDQEMEDGVYYSIFEDDQEVEYKFLCASFAEYFALMVSSKGRVLNSLKAI